MDHFGYVLEPIAGGMKKEAAASFETSLDRDIYIIKTAAVEGDFSSTLAACDYVDRLERTGASSEQLGEVFEKVAAAAIEADVEALTAGLLAEAAPEEHQLIQQEVAKIAFDLVKEAGKKDVAEWVLRGRAARKAAKAARKRAGRLKERVRADEVRTRTGANMTGSGHTRDTYFKANTKAKNLKKELTDVERRGSLHKSQWGKGGSPKDPQLGPERKPWIERKREGKKPTTPEATKDTRGLDALEAERKRRALGNAPRMGDRAETTAFEVGRNKKPGTTSSRKGDDGVAEYQKTQATQKGYETLGRKPSEKEHADIIAGIQGAAKKESERINKVKAGLTGNKPGSTKKQAPRRDPSVGKEVGATSSVNQPRQPTHSTRRRKTPERPPEGVDDTLATAGKRWQSHGWEGLAKSQQRKLTAAGAAGGTGLYLATRRDSGSKRGPTIVTT